ncbi:hypothetical protein ACFVQB_29200 [Paenibacillus sp. NPDC057886]|uniref:hypothetical protein n=1 Tax=Paenibacillus sp. NPDC057886 TaxID=3346270 RepID=UPI00369C9A8C
MSRPADSGRAMARAAAASRSNAYMPTTAPYALGYCSNPPSRAPAELISGSAVRMTPYGSGSTPHAASTPLSTSRPPAICQPQANHRSPFAREANMTVSNANIARRLQRSISSKLPCTLTEPIHTCRPNQPAIAKGQSIQRK